MIRVLGKHAYVIIWVEAGLKIVTAGATEMLFPLQLCSRTSLKTLTFRFPDFLPRAFGYNHSTSHNDLMTLAHYCV
jgi:hypothetical protein